MLISHLLKKKRFGLINQFQLYLKKFDDYLDKNVFSANEVIVIRALCIKLDSGELSFFNINELNEMIILLCTT